MHNRLDNKTPVPARGLLGTLFAMIGGVVLLVAGFFFSLIILAAIAVVGLLVFGYWWWKTRALRKHLQAQMDYMAQHEPMDASSSSDQVDGEIIEGVVVSEEREPPG